MWLPRGELIIFLVLQIARCYLCGRSTLMKRPLFNPERILNAFPESREEILRCTTRFKKYSSDCGCSMGAMFLLASVAIYLAYLVVSQDWRTHFPRQLLFGIVLIFISSALGKLIGIGLARLKLAVLQKYLMARFPLQENHHVHMH